MRHYLFIILTLALCSTGLLRAQNCTDSRAYAVLQGNDVRAGLRAGGDFFWNGNEAQFQVPYSTTTPTPTPSTMFAGALWLGAYDAGGNLHLAAQTYRSQGNDFWTGPLDANGQTVAATCDDYDHIWQVARWEIEQHQQDFDDNGVINGPVSNRILAWPGRGNPQFRAQMGFSLPNQQLAPFYDRNGNGSYEPMLGDYPVYDHNNATAIAEEILWWVFNDNGNLHTQTNGQPLKAEIQTTAWSFYCDRNDLANKTIFMRHAVTNKSGQAWLDFKMGLWNDSDLGCGNDDYIGTDSTLNTVYWYNRDNNDDSPCGTSGTWGYGPNPPVQSMTLLNHDLDANTYHINSNSDPKGDPSSALGYYRLLDAIWPNGTPLSVGGDGYDPALTNTVTHYAFPSLPLDVNGWSMYQENLSGLDQRTVSSVHEASIADGGTFTVDVAYTYHRGPGNNHVQNVNFALQRVVQLQQWYDNGLPLNNCTQPAACATNCVYPGDLNNNGIVNDFDLLELGVAMGQNASAAPRALTRDNWFPYDLPTPATNGYLDANGNGQIDLNDWAANTAHWGNTHDRYTGAAEGANTQGDDLRFERSYPPFFSYDTVVQRGGNFSAQIFIGQATQPINNLYGLTFEVEYDPDVIEPANRFGGPWSFRLPLSNNWLGGSVRARPAVDGRAHYVNVRTDGQDSSGTGFLALLDFRVRADAAIMSDTMRTNICFRNFKAVDPQGNTIPLGAQCLTIEYLDSNYVTSVSDVLPTDYRAQLYPNPTQDQTTLEVTLAQAEQLTVTLLDLTGRVVYTIPAQALPKGTHQLTLSTQDLPSGIYHCRIASKHQQQVLPLVKGRR